MNLNLLRQAVRFACAGALSLVFVASAAALDAPKFSDPEVTAFAKSYLEFTEEAIVAYKAVKAGDTAKAQSLQAKSEAIQAQAGAITAKASTMKPEEAEKFQKFMMECVQRMTEAMK